MVDDALRFVRTLRERGAPNLTVSSVVLDGEYHSTVPIAVLTRGLRHVFEQR
jgi:hypothetical protein